MTWVKTHKAIPFCSFTYRKKSLVISGSPEAGTRVKVSMICLNALFGQLSRGKDPFILSFLASKRPIMRNLGSKCVKIPLETFLHGVRWLGLGEHRQLVSILFPADVTLVSL